MTALESNQFIVECEHCLNLHASEVGVEGYVSVEDTQTGKSYRLEFEVVREEERKIHIPRALRDMDRGAEDVLSNLDHDRRRRFEGLVEDMNDPGAGHQESCPQPVKKL